MTQKDIPNFFLPVSELIEKLEEIAGKDDIVVPDVPEAPDLATLQSSNNNEQAQGSQEEE